MDLTWETTEDDGEREDGIVMVAFSGSSDAEQCAAWAREERKGNYIGALRVPYPGMSEQMERTEFVNWPAEEWSMASYYFPRLNEVTFWGPFWKAGYGGWLHFAGRTHQLCLHGIYGRSTEVRIPIGKTARDP